MGLDDNSLDSVARVTSIPTNLGHNFNKTTSSGNIFIIKKGQLNKLRLRPQILNEHAESSRNIINTVSSGNIVGQIFKASQDNINGISLALESAAITVLDDFESYADNSALQTAWVASGSDLALLNTAITDPSTSTQSMQLDTSAAVGTEWVFTTAAADFTGATGSLRYRASAQYASIKLRFFIGDGTNTKSSPITQSDSNIWEKIEISEAQLTEDGGGTTNTAAITKVGFRIESKSPGSTVWVDTMVSAPPPGSVDIKIFDMGSTLPESGVTKLSDGTQYTKIGDLGLTGLQEASFRLALEGGFRSYLINNFVCGPALEIPANEVLTPGNYYALTINYVDTNTSVYGPDASLDNYYKSGYSFTTPDEVSVMTATGVDEDINFIIYSTQDVYVDGFLNFIDATPNGNATTSLYIEDENMIRSDTMTTGVKPPQTVIRDLQIPAFLPKGGKIEQEYNDDFTDSVSKITFTFIYYFKKEEANG